jgi:serine/threonine-protein kinase BUR1
MAEPLGGPGDGESPRTFARKHARDPASFRGCSSISQYEILGKLGEGTFGYVVAMNAVFLGCFPPRSLFRSSSADAKFSEVHRARSRTTGSLVALKKIIIYHEKDGVW